MRTLSQNRRLAIAALALACAVPAAMGAEAEGDSLLDMDLGDLLNMEIEVGAAKAQNIFKTVSTVTVVDREMIERYQFRSVAEALMVVSGATVTRTYLKRNLPTLRGILQDHYANKVLVMIEGVPAWNAVTGESSLDRVDIGSVERIEVLKGPASVVYGTNAYSGAINIVLRKAREDGISGHMSAGAGSHGYYMGGGGVSYRKGDDLVVTVSGAASDEDGHTYDFTGEAETFDPLTSSTDTVSERRTAGVQEYVYGSSINVHARYRFVSLLFNSYRSHEGYLGVAPKFASGAGNDHVATGYLAKLGLDHQFAKWLTVRYSLSYDWQNRDLSRTFDDNTRASIQGQRVTNALTLLSEPFENFVAQLGGSYDYRVSNEYRNYRVYADETLAENNMNDREVWEASGLLQLGYSMKYFSVLIGGRYTKNELFDNNLSGRITLVGTINERNSVKFIAGQSYRAPAVFEQYFQTSSNTVFGSTDLKPETSTSYELAYLTNIGPFFGQILGYYAHYDNKIFRVRKDITRDGIDYTNVNVYDNGDRFEAFGAELETKLSIPKVIDAFVNYAFVYGDAADEVGDHYNFKYIPQHTLSAGLSKRLSGFSLSTVGNAMSSTEGPNETIDEQFSIDVNMGYRHTLASHTISHALTLKNLTDAEMSVPEYVRHNQINSVPSGFGRRIAYELSVEL